MSDELKAGRLSFIIPHSSLRLFVRSVLAAAAAELPELQPLRRRLLILRRHVVAALALGALQHDVVARHNLPLSILASRFLISLHDSEASPASTRKSKSKTTR
jgi:hypothetical protein